jgi:hypothetical protein
MPFCFFQLFSVTVGELATAALKYDGVHVIPFRLYERETLLSHRTPENPGAPKLSAVQHQSVN